MKNDKIACSLSRRQVLTGSLIALTTGLALGPFYHLVRAEGKNSRGWQAASQSLEIRVDADGSYKIFILGQAWLSSAPTSVHLDGTWYSAGDSSKTTVALKQTATSNGEGRDKLGSYRWHKIIWKAGSTSFETSFRLYDQVGCIVFAHSFPDGASAMALTASDKSTRGYVGVNGAINGTDVSSAFPAFKVSALKPDLNYLSYHGCMAHPQRGSVEHFGDFCGGTEAGVPLILFDEHLRTAVLSPLNHFANAVQVNSQVMPDTLACGLSGRVDTVPSGFTQETILFAGHGVNQTMFDWGSQLLAKSGKSRLTPASDTTVNNIGYWTDNGAFYYYNTEPGKNYQTTILDLAAYLKQEKYPAHYLQLDSWWYQKGKDEGTALWQPRPDVFPDGFEWLGKQVGLPFAVHNRYWSTENPYQDRFHFVKDKTAAIPLDPGFWQEIMGWARTNGIILYEQDWLNVAYERVSALQTNVLLEEQWLEQMDTAAQVNGLQIMYCMPLPSHYLNSTLCHAVSQIRASSDYCPGSDQWKIGLNAMLANSVGLAPFKDIFWSSELQPGNTYNNGTVTEPNFELQALVSALSRGAVGPGDKIGCLNTPLVLKTCRADGLILKADKPATTIDRCFKPGGPTGEIWDTTTKFGEHTWLFLLVADQQNQYQLSSSDLKVYAPHAVLETQSGSLHMMEAGERLTVGGTAPPRLGAVSLQYFVLAPADENGLAFLGETNKFITVSRERFRAIANHGKSITVAGIAGESIELSWAFTKSPPTVKIDGRALQPGDTQNTAQITGHIFGLVLTIPGAGVVTLDLT